MLYQNNHFILKVKQDNFNTQSSYCLQQSNTPPFLIQQQTDTNSMVYHQDVLFIISTIEIQDKILTE